MGQEVPGSLRPRIFLTFGTTRVLGRQSYAPAAFTPGGIPGTHFQRLSYSGPEGSRKLGFPDFMTTAQDGVKVVSLTHRPPLPQVNTPGTHFC